MKNTFWLLISFSLLLPSCGSGDEGNGQSCMDSGKGIGNFEENVISKSYVHGQEMEIVDMDKDGAQDLLVAYSLTDAIHLYVNRCDSWKRIAITPSKTLVATGVASGDFDGDGDLDIVAAEVFDRANTEGGTVRWYENSGDVEGKWTEHLVANLGGARKVSVADISGDGKPDIVVGTANYGPGIQWFRNTGGTFAAAQVIDTNIANINSFVVHDFNGDGALDVVVAASQEDELAWYESERGEAQGDTFGFTKHLIDKVDGIFGVAIGNMDDDPAMEVIANNSRGIEYYDAEDVNGAWAATSISTDFAGDDIVFLVSADLNGDGKDDVAAVSRTSSAGHAYLRDSSGFNKRKIVDGYRGMNNINSGDIDGDGDIDLVTSTYDRGSRDRISWWANKP